MKCTSNASAAKGRVYLIGAGPGAPGLITLRGVQLLQQADAVLYDYLANPQMLAHAAPDAILQCVGKHGRSGDNSSGSPSTDAPSTGSEPAKIWSQQAINERMIDLAGAGQQVVRLKGGDPSIFARAAEEINALEAAGIEYEIVPGVTTAMAAAAFAATSLTDRDQASAVALVTGRESEKDISHLNFPSLAAFPGTLVIYMGVVSVADWSQSLLQAGKSPDSPCAIIRRCSLPDQQTWQCRLDEVAQLVGGKRLRPPIVFVVGRQGWKGPGQSWYEQKPLFGQRVVVTRPPDQAGELIQLLEGEGADVIAQPAIELQRLEDQPQQDQLDTHLKQLDRYDWVVFSSRNGVAFTLQRMAELQLDARAFAGVRLAAVGSATAESLAAHSLIADLIADKSQQEGLVESLGGLQLANQRILLLRASRGRDVMAAALTQMGHSVDQVTAYESRDIVSVNPRVGETLRQRPADWIIAASSASAKSAHRLLAPFAPDAKWVAISPLTGDALRECGANVQAVANQPSNEAIVEAIIEATSKQP